MTNQSDQGNVLSNPMECPICSSRVKELPQGRATFFECDCGFKLVTTRELYPNCFVNLSELWPPSVE